MNSLVVAARLAFALLILFHATALAQPRMVTLPLDGDTIDFFQVPLGASSRDIWVKIENVGDAALKIMAVKISSGPIGMMVPSEDFRITDRMGVPESFTVLPFESVKLSLVFAPTSTGPLDATLEISPDPVDPSLTPVHIGLIGRGVPPIIRCSTDVPDNSLPFGKVAVGSASEPLHITIANDGVLPQSLVITSDDVRVVVHEPATTVQSMIKATVSVTVMPIAVQHLSGFVTVASLGSIGPPACRVPFTAEGVVASEPDSGSASGSAVLASRDGCSCATGGSAMAPTQLLMLMGAVHIVRRRNGRRGSRAPG